VVDWNVPFLKSGSAANVGVFLNLVSQQSLNQPPLDDIKSVYVDNTGSSIPIYLVFPSTGFVVSIAPNTSDWYPVYTIDYSVQVYALGLTTNNIPKTGIWFANILMQPYSDPEISQTQDLWLASHLITRGTTIFNTNFGIPALGDQIVSGGLSITANGTVTIYGGFGPDAAFIYMTQMQLAVQNANIGGANAAVQLIFESTGIAGIFIQYEFDMVAGQTTVANEILFDLHGNYKIDGTQTWRLRVNKLFGTFTAGNCTLYISTTTNPQ
jgi:hypothetical protein